MNKTEKIDRLISRGVRIPNPTSVEISSEVDINKISSDGVVIHSGCKIFGKSSTISAKVQLGSEGPVTVNNCQIACNVKLKGGYFDNSVFMEGVIAELNSHVRPGSILEEHSKIAHSVGLKQTILFPFVKIGSFVNLCDCFMSGGTSDKNHSEVGSSYIHFNYTPNQDKATPSLIGDVANGVMLNKNPIFLGGQGGLVGPCRINYGTVIAAGSVHRKDQLEEDRLIFANNNRSRSMKHLVGIYRSVGRQALNNIIYIANLMALMCWYINIRILFVLDSFSMAIFKSLIKTLENNIKERVNKFELFCYNLKKSTHLSKKLLSLKDSDLLIKQKKELYLNRYIVKDVIYSFLEKIYKKNKINSKFIFHITNQVNSSNYNYLNVIKGLPPDISLSGTIWLKKIVKEVIDNLLNLFPSLR